MQQAVEVIVQQQLVEERDKNEAFNTIIDQLDFGISVNREKKELLTASAQGTGANNNLLLEPNAQDTEDGEKEKVDFVLHNDQLMQFFKIIVNQPEQPQANNSISSSDYELFALNTDQQQPDTTSHESEGEHFRGLANEDKESLLKRYFEYRFFMPIGTASDKAETVLKGISQTCMTAKSHQGGPD